MMYDLEVGCAWNKRFEQCQNFCTTFFWRFEKEFNVGPMRNAPNEPSRRVNRRSSSRQVVHEAARAALTVCLFIIDLQIDCCPPTRLNDFTIR
jgi:hypothetical protein